MDRFSCPAHSVEVEIETSLPPTSQVFVSESIFDDGLIGHFDALAPDSIEYDIEGNVTCIKNLKGGLNLNASSSGAPIYVHHHSFSKGRPAFVWPQQANNLGFELPMDAPCSHLFVVKAYKTGVETSWDDYTTLVTDLIGINSPDGQRLVGNQGANDTWSNFKLTGARKNGGAYSSQILPLPLSVMHYSAADAGITHFNIASVGGQNKAESGRSWQGIVCEVLAYAADAVLDEDAIDSITRNLIEKWGITP